ncbi:apolipoprotein N-acyltransferase [Actinospica sp.]|uniref:apolipoprotein N-acyltransferase n=1 Tax=Actinospica sp. TaxID=1872142 RepID=UPI002C94ECA2|nr:apolipoprotein N-acyltransferase [Actinospica sp.]HWG25296.1 apolipoprotein N-acyltransferase [Actinospica sp.]
MKISRTGWWAPRLGTVLAGAVGFLLFPAPNLGVLAWVAFVPLLLLLRAADSRREAMLRGWLGGFGFVCATLYWLLPNLIYFFPLAAALVAVLWLPWGLLVWAVLRPDSPPVVRTAVGRGEGEPVASSQAPGPFGWGRGLLALAAVPAGWVLIETVRSWKPFGGPWSLLGASQWNHPAELGLASVGGAWLLSFAIMLVNTCIVLIITARVPVRVGAAVLGALAIVAGPVWFATHPMPAATRDVNVALVQPGVVHDPQARDQEGIAITRALQSRQVGLVVWGESSGDDGLIDDGNDQQQLTQLATSLHAPIVVNANATVPDGDTQKVSYLYSAAGEQGQYAKTRLVMFGEYIPFRGQLSWLTRMTKAAGTNLVAGDDLTMFRAGGMNLGPLICFESAFPDMARNEANLGAQLLVYQSEDTTFQGSWEPAQHASLAAVRSAETGRPAVQASLAGVSAAFDAQGRELAWLPKEYVGSIVAHVPLQAADTPYDRYGNFVPIVCAGLVALALLAMLRLRLLMNPVEIHDPTQLADGH